MCRSGIIRAATPAPSATGLDRRCPRIRSYTAGGPKSSPRSEIRNVEKRHRRSNPQLPVHLDTLSFPARALTRGYRKQYYSMDKASGLLARCAVVFRRTTFPLPPAAAYAGPWPNSRGCDPARSIKTGPYRLRIGRIRWYCLPKLIRMSSISSFKLRKRMVSILARTKSFCPVAAMSRSMPEPIEARVMPVL